MLARIAAIAALAPIVALAQVRTDSSLGRPATAIPGPNYVIPQDLGRLAGRNLFHSFDTFNVGYGESATFTASTPGLANILARVTGGGSSQINGLLAVDAVGAHPALWLINPAGVMFGNGAILNVPGGFHVTTANFIHFADGDFHADSSKTSTFSSLSPEAYGFLGSTRAIVSIDGATVRNHGPVDIVAGDVSLSNATLRTGSSDVRIVAMGRQVATVGTDGPVTGAAGSVSIQNAAIRTEASAGNNGGNISLYAGGLFIDGIGTFLESGLLSTTEGAGKSGDITVEVGGKVTIVNGGAIATTTSGKGNAGDVHFHAGELSIDGKGLEDTGIVSLADQAATGKAGTVDVNVAGTITLYEGATIASDTGGAGSAGEVRVASASLLIDGRGNGDAFTGISSDSREGASGPAGRVSVQVSGAITMIDGAEISSQSSGSDAGSVEVTAGSISMDGKDNPDTTTAIHSTANGPHGTAGTVRIVVDGLLSIANSALIDSDTYSDGNAGGVNITAGEIRIDGGTALFFTGISSDAVEGLGSAGNVEVHAGKITIVNTGQITSDTYTGANAGNVTVNASEIRIDGTGHPNDFTGISSDAADGTGSAGSVTVHADKITLFNMGEIASDTFTPGRAGSVLVTAGELLIDGNSSAYFTGVSSNSNIGASGAAGKVEVRADTLTLLNGGQVVSGTYTEGRAGDVSVTAGRLVIDAGDGRWTTGISTDSREGSGAAGNVTVHAGDAVLLRGGSITSNTSTSGDAGAVLVTADTLSLSGVPSGSSSYSAIESRALSGTGNSGIVEVDVSGNATLADSGSISSSTNTSGRAGDVTVRIGGNLAISGSSNSLSGIFSNTYSPSGGPAGSIDVAVTGALSLAHGGVIESDTHAVSNAGSIRISAGSLQITGSNGTTTGISTDSAKGAGGQAGDITVTITNDATISAGGYIASRTQSAGGAGQIQIHANNLVIDGSGTANLTGVSTGSNDLTSGDAGQIEIQVIGDLALRNGGAISSATSSSRGVAGSIDVRAGNLIVDGASGTSVSQVSARSSETGSGQTGEISIAATGSITVSNGGQITLANASSPADTSHITASNISLAAPDIFITSSGSVTTQSSGNVNASNIAITAPGLLMLDSGSITTSANLGNGGTITIDAGKIRLVDSQVQTSVLGTRGNGGDISIRADALLLETGFIQANTAARDAAGGNVAIDAKVLAASGGSVFIGGSEPIAFVPGAFGLNVIQAAAPTGVSGAIELTSPVLDTSGALAGLGAATLDTSLVGRSPCRLGAGSSLALAGRGGLAPSARDGFRIDPPALASAGSFASGLPSYAGSPCRVARADF